ncbi:Rho-type guanine nucleotide exchange factor [Strongyloides ratti]|uniref:Rho-type guanine nucleotide exchange factor n=1 Tax=Strongyloides ratti TaxID=34506 RepID=A0A090KZL1_STRRB|nr:Rho-type guanine nucleotide exchange factor [Strongyloides ratti]CEF62866.1 Rho-type guanine nucleotide exchange factor [Strongyloides ratti]
MDGENNQRTENEVHDSETYRAVAKFDFEGKNNDELSFPRSAVIKITQMLEGGWWEGTYNGNVGWFPENYVTLIDDDIYEEINGTTPTKLISNSGGNMKFRDQTIEEFMDFMGKMIIENKQIYEEYILKLGDIEELKKNNDVINFVKITQKLKETLSLPVTDQRIGGVLLYNAKEYKELLKEYCFRHPVVIENITLINNKKQNLLEDVCGVPLKDIVMGLSSYFRNIEKYANHLLEIDRNSKSNHPDLGDLRRAAAVYRSMASFCLTVRKQKEGQMDFISGQYISKFGKTCKNIGDIKWLGIVEWKKDGGCHTKDGKCSEERYYGVFENKILIIELIIETATYKLVDSHTTNNIYVRKNIEGKHSFGIGNEIENDYIIIVTNDDEFEILSGVFNEMKMIKNINIEQCIMSNPTSPVPQIRSDILTKCNSEKNLELTNGVILREKNQRSNSSVGMTRTECALSSESKKTGSDIIGGIKVNHDLGIACLESDDDYCEPPITPVLSKNVREISRLPSSNENKTFDIEYNSNINTPLILPRPLPPNTVLEKYMGIDSMSNVKMRKKSNSCGTEQGDTELLNLIDEFYSAFKVAGVEDLSNSLSDAIIRMDEQGPQLIVADEEKIFIEEVDEKTGEITLKEKTLVDTVYSLRDSVTHLQEDVAEIKKLLQNKV